MQNKFHVINNPNKSFQFMPQTTQPLQPNRNLFVYNHAARCHLAIKG